MAIGSEAYAASGSDGTFNESIAIGRQSKALGDQSIAMGGQAKATGNSSIAIGADDLDRVASTTPPVWNATGNNESLNNTAVAKTFKDLTGGYLVNFENNQDGTPGIGKRFTLTESGEAAVSLGAKSTANNLATAVGATSTASGIASVALGVHSTAQGEGALAIGPIAKAKGKGSTAVGINSTADGQFAIAIGSASTSALGVVSSGENAVAIGSSAQATKDNSVALGSYATTDTDATQQSSATLNGLTYGTFAGQVTDPGMQVSVGSVGAERQIKNVGSGEISATSTDAINGSQLYATNAILSNVANSTKNIIGGDVTLDAAGNVTGPFTANGTDYNNIAEAIEGESAAAKTEVKQGKNITVTATADPDDGHAIYTVETADEVEFDKVTVGSVVVDAANNDITGLANTTLGATDFATAGRAATEEQLSSVSDSVANIIGGNVSNVGGSITGPFTANGTDYNNIAEAIEGESAAAKTEVKQGKNITVTATADPDDGHAIYTVETADEVEFDKVTVGSVVVDAANNDITGLANTTLGATDFATAGRAATEEQLSSVSDSVADIIGGGVTNVGGAVTGPFTANGTNYDNIADAIEGEAAAAKTEVEEGKNISVTSITGKDGQTIYTVATADEVEFDKVTVGNTTITTDGLTIVGGPSITTAGINAGGKKVTNVADGEIAEDSTDAVNGSQLYALGDNITNLFGGNALYVNNQISWSNIGGTGQNTVDDAIRYVNDQAANANQGWKVTTDSGNAATSTVKPGDTVSITGDTASGVTVSNNGNDIKIGLADKVTIGSGSNAVSIDGNAGTIQVGDVHIDGSTGNITAGQVTVNGEAGTVNGLTNTTWNPADIVSGQAATEDQLKQVADNAAQAAAVAKSTVSEGENITVSPTKNADGSTNYQVATKKDVTFDKVTSGSVIADKVTVGKVVIDQAGINAGGNKVTNVADGAISSTSKDAINGSQLHASNTNIYNYLGGGANYETNTGPTYNVGGGSHNNVGDALTALDDRDNQLDNKITNLGDQLQQAFYTTNERIDDVEKRANAGIAAAMALETAPYVAGKWTYAAATSYHGGENAVGVTFRKTADNGRWSLTSGIAAASQGDPSFRIGISGVID
ncbi:YadA-like family protein [Acinetobacter towneri]|uniref:YadA-like family protein n=1 Tax=Acinetobacter towneri TaxID=202956 RepID=UPI00384B7635